MEPRNVPELERLCFREWLYYQGLARECEQCIEPQEVIESHRMFEELYTPAKTSIGQLVIDEEDKSDCSNSSFAVKQGTGDWQDLNEEYGK